MKRFIDGADRGQSTLFPECVEDWIGEDNPVRVIDVLVDGLDLAELGFGGVDPEATGRPSYHPSILLKLYIYGYLNQVQSSRRLEREAGRNVEVMWLLGRLAPDHKTIADFRKDNGLALRKVCARFVELSAGRWREYPFTRPIRVERMSHEDADAENETRCRDYLGHPANSFHQKQHHAVPSELERKAACVATSGPSLGSYEPDEGSDSASEGTGGHATAYPI
jgi:transposase